MHIIGEPYYRTPGIKKVAGDTPPDALTLPHPLVNRTKAPIAANEIKTGFSRLMNLFFIIILRPIQRCMQNLFLNIWKEDVCSGKRITLPMEDSSSLLLN